MTISSAKQEAYWPPKLRWISFDDISVIQDRCKRLLAIMDVPVLVLYGAHPAADPSAMPVFEYGYCIILDEVEDPSRLTHYLRQTLQLGEHQLDRCARGFVFAGVMVYIRKHNNTIDT